MRPILEVNLDTIIDNYYYLQNLTKAEVSCVLKADAYGMGAIEVSKILWQHGCKKFFVAALIEALELKSIIPEANIYLLNGFFEDEINEIIKYNITPVINSLEQLSFWDKNLPCVIHIDTGMNRLGLTVAEFKSLELSHNVEFFMTHLACDSDVTNSYNSLQLGKFLDATKKYPNIKKSVAASGGLYLSPEYHFDIVRIGCLLYGGYDRSYPELKNPVTLSVPIIQIRTCEEDEFVGYSCTAKVQKGSVIGVITIGYADGFFRFFSNKGFVFYKGKKAKIIGNVSMDLTMIDITDLDLKVGDMVEIFNDEFYPYDAAKMIGTITYEILTALRSSSRFYKLYKYTKYVI
jgi:alanine racemase